ncbi:hypothetical protein FJY94_02090 [Candidatus Kaiserbacteria bacterium]|nr:hypothetical protein [Candidatus Kaiserbacteria bacterium]
MLARVDQHTAFDAGVIAAATKQFAIVELRGGRAVIDQGTTGRDEFEHGHGDLGPGDQVRCYIVPMQPGDAYQRVESFF